MIANVVRISRDFDPSCAAIHGYREYTGQDSSYREKAMIEPGQMKAQAYDRTRPVLAAIKRIEAKRDAQADPLCWRYYELCLIGWWQHLARLGE
jgi:hypothetical protein